MQAVISGQAGVALLLEDQRLRSLHAGTAEIIPRRPREIPYLLGDATDLQFLEDVEIPEVSGQLEIATAQADALHIALILLDPELPQDVRCDAANELAKLFALEGVREYVESVLFAHPLPSEADLPGALSCCSAQSVAVRDLLVSLERLQSEILEVFTAWERIPTPEFGEEKDRASALATAVREGLFRDFVLCRAVHASVDQFLIDAVIKTKMRCGWKILYEWMTHFFQHQTVAEVVILPQDFPETRVSQEDFGSLVARIGKRKRVGSR